MSTYSPVFLSAYTIVAWLESVLCLNLRNHLRFFIMRANAQVVQQQRVDFAKWKEDTMFCSIDETKRNAVITMLITGKPFGKPEFFWKQYILPSSAWICGVTYVGSHIRKFHVVFGACVSHQSTVIRNKTVIHCDFFYRGHSSFGGCCKYCKYCFPFAKKRVHIQHCANIFFVFCGCNSKKT